MWNLVLEKQAHNTGCKGVQVAPFCSKDFLFLLLRKASTISGCNTFKDSLNTNEHFVKTLSFDNYTSWFPKKTIVRKDVPFTCAKCFKFDRVLQCKYTWVEVIDIYILRPLIFYNQLNTGHAPTKNISFFGVH